MWLESPHAVGIGAFLPFVFQQELGWQHFSSMSQFPSHSASSNYSSFLLRDNSSFPSDLAEQTT